MRFGLGVVALAFAICTTACSSRFSEADVTKTESDIRTQLEQKGFVVEQVSMIKDSDRHLSGFAKVRKPWPDSRQTRNNQELHCHDGCGLGEIHLGM
jgi:hypothetical protein